MDRGSTFFRLGCLVEGGFVLAAAVLGSLLGRPVLDGLRGNVLDAAVGMLASLPLFLLFLCLHGSTWAPLREIRRFLEKTLRPLAGGWSIGQMVVISALAGLGEECFFRGLVQGGLAQWLGPAPALALASLLFGLCHCPTWAYAVVATLIGACFGLLWICSGSLLTPIVAHATYDFGVLVYLLRLRPRHGLREG